jgi:hypothetical protein
MKQMIIAAAIAAAVVGGAYAQTADKSGVAPNAPTKRMDAAVPEMKDPTGKKDLGVDISSAGTTPREHQQFVQNLPPATQSNVKRVCTVFVGEPDNHATEVVHFCENVNQM